MVIGALALAVVILAAVFVLLLRRQLREKYAIIWIVIALAVLMLAIFPDALDFVTLRLGFQVPANLLFTLAIFLLLAVALHLSWELSRAEEEIRKLAEEAGLSRMQNESNTAAIARLENALDQLRADHSRNPE